MPTLSFEYDADKVGRTLVRNNVRNQTLVLGAMRGTVHKAQENVVQRGRIDISEAGNYTGEWLTGLTATVTEEGHAFKIAVAHTKPMYGFLNKGGIIKGQPLLWIPVSSADDAKGLGSPLNFPGRLIQVNRKGGVPLLISADTKEVKFAGIREVRIPQKFHIKAIIRQVVSELKKYYSESLAGR